MERKLDRSAYISIVAVMVVEGLLVFGAAGTLVFWQAWAMFAVYGLGSVLVTAYFLKHDRALLERRMHGGPMAEKEPAQRVIMAFISVLFCAIFVAAGLDRKLGWSSVPPAVSVVGDVLLGLGFYATFLVFRENSFASATIEKSEGQRVISTGLYARIRHPMYAGGSVLLLGIPLALGSLVAFLPLLAAFPFLVWRIFDEERYLLQHLEGYDAYRRKVRYRVIPHVF